MSLSINGNYNEGEIRWDFKLIGEVDIANAHYFKKQLETAYQQQQADIQIDLSDLSYIDSTGLGVIIGVYGAIKSKGNKVMLINPKENVKKLLRITSLDKVLS
jgi:anti-sigma B factor antagonist